MRSLELKDDDDDDDDDDNEGIEADAGEGFYYKQRSSRTEES